MEKCKDKSHFNNRRKNSKQAKNLLRNGRENKMNFLIKTINSGKAQTRAYCMMIILRFISRMAIRKANNKFSKTRENRNNMSKSNILNLQDRKK